MPQDSVMLDNAALINYVTDHLDGVIGQEYADPRGQGRITIVNEPDSFEVAEPRPAPPAEAKRYSVAAGDTLWSIAVKQLGQGSRWKEIYKLNQDTISNPNVIHIGQTLKLSA